MRKTTSKTPVISSDTSKPAIGMPPGYNAGAVIRNGVVNGVCAIGNGFAFVGSRVVNFGKGLLNVSPTP